MVQSDALATRLRMGGTYPVAGKREEYGVRNVPGGMGLMFGAGALSGLPEHHFGLDEIVAAHEAVEHRAVGKVFIDLA